jgi:uncharacterized phage protein gp47/JayE
VSVDPTSRLERVLELGGGTLSDALLAAAASASAAPERWLLPTGSFTLDPTALMGLDVALRGDGTVLTGGGSLEAGTLVLESLQLTGDWALAGGVVRLGDLGVSGTLVVDAGEVVVEGLRADAGVGVGVELRATGPAVVTDVGVAGTGGDVRVALLVTAGSAELRRVQVVGTGGAPAVTGRAPMDGWADTVGISVQASGPVVATDLDVGELTGASVVALRLLAGGACSVADLRVAGVSGTVRGFGGLLAAAGDLVLRGVQVSDIAAPLAEGLRIGGQAAVEVAGGTLSGIVGTDGHAAGVRVLLPAQARAIELRDLAINGVGRGEALDPVTTPAVHLGEPAAAFSTWADALAATWPAPAFPVPTPPSAPDVSALHVDAPIEEWEASGADVPVCDVEDCALERVGGVAVRISAPLRPVSTRRMLAWACAAPGWVAGEDVLIAEWTAHLQAAPLALGPGEHRLYNLLVTGGPGLVFDSPFPEDAVIVEARSVWAQAPDLRIRPLSAPPYASPGPAALPADILVGGIPPFADVDLRLVDGPPPYPVPEDTQPAQMGAVPPAAGRGCSARDPAPPALPAVPRVEESSPIADYLARDYTSLRALLLARADQVMPGWTARGGADLTLTLFELFADRLDLLAQAQEAALQESWLDTARLRRSVEEHALQLGYVADPGLSATALLRFSIDPDAARAAGVGDPSTLAPGGRVVIPAGTLVSLATHRDGAVVFATDEDLTLVAGGATSGLDTLRLRQDVVPGATDALVEPWPGMELLQPGRWLLLFDPRSREGHPVRVTTVREGVEGTRVGWDPRRASPRTFTSDGCVVYANVVPAQHGIPLVGGAPDDLFGAWNALLELQVDGVRGGREVRLPVGPVSVQAAGVAFPGELRQGTAALSVTVDGDPWRRVATLADARPLEEAYVLRNDEVETLLRFGDGENGQALPAREVTVRVDARVGLGRLGNVGAGTLVNVLRLGPTRDEDEGLADRLEAHAAIVPPLDLLKAWLKVENAVAATGGRDPEPLDRVRYRAPLAVDDLRSAVTVADYETLLLALPEVRAVRASVERRLPRPLVRVTALLRDEDTLVQPERLRRWALVRARLDAVRLLGTDVELLPPIPAPLDLDVVVDAMDTAPAPTLRQQVEAALRGDGGLFDPDRQGLGRDVLLSDLYRAALAVPGVREVRVRRFRRLGGDDALADGVIPVAPDERPALDAGGVLTVTVCGGRQ